MLSTSELIASKFAMALKTSGVKQSEIAIGCKVSKQAVQGWLKTGRIDKKHLSKLACLTNTELSWWLDATESQNYPNAELAARLKAADPATVKLVELALYESDPEAISKLSPSLVAMVRGLKAAIELQGNT